MSMFRLLVAFVLVLVPIARGQEHALPTDPRLVTGTLDNGLRYIILHHETPPGRASIWLHVGTGSLNEGEQQRGLAHFLEHMAFNGSEHFAPGTVINFFQSLGMSFGVHQNAFTIFDKTVYQLALPDAKPETLDKGLLFLSDVAFRLKLLPEEIEKERQVIQEERIANLGGMQRVFDTLLENYSPGSLFGRRLPIGLEGTINGVSRDDFVKYYTTRYVPGNMTVMVVADADPAMVAERVRAAFKDGKKADVPPDADPGVKETNESRAIVAADKELAIAQVSITRVGPAGPPVTTVEGLRRQSVRLLGTQAFNRRMKRKVAEGRVAFFSGSASVSDQFRAIRLVEVSAACEPARWRQSLTDLGTELRRAALHGFSGQEIDDVRREMLAQAERAVEVEPTIPAQAILSVMDDSLGNGEPILSAEQYSAILHEVLPTITPEEVSAKFAQQMDPGDGPALYILTMPAGDGVPTEPEFLALGREALHVSPESELGGERAASLMEERPKPGRVAEELLDGPSQVWSGWLDNGVRFHYRFMDYRKDQVGVTVLLAGGELQETAETRGVSEAAALAWQRQATSKLSSSDIRDLMVGKKVSVQGRSGLDTMAISISGSPADLEPGFQLAHLLLTDPVIEGPAFDTWRAQQRQLLAFRSKSIELVFSDLISDAFYPKGGARLHPLTGGQIDAITREGAQAFLNGLIAHAPIEVTVVGDLPRERAMELVTTYLGSLPSRERISDTTLDGLRNVPVPEGPITLARTLETETDKAIVLSGFFGTDITNVKDKRLLAAAAKILTTRMIESLREERQLVYSIGVQSSPAVELPGFGTVHAYSDTAPGKVGALRDAITAMLDEFAAKGPTDDEMAVMKKQMANTLDESMREPSYWSRAISSSTYRGTSLHDAADEAGAYAPMTAAQVRDAFARYYTPGSVFSISVSPVKPAAPAASPAR
ncbi:MAG: insulinase family protein [Phycisphaerales bacterium]|nr:insulinase family protein [Phycisphaerales bacterium]